MNHKIKIKIGSHTFSATLVDNQTAIAFKALLPISVSMTELNENEKYCQLPKALPVNPSVPSSIQTGDLMIFGTNTLVLFYKTFKTSYGYTQIGKIDDTSGLITALGSGNVTITYELTQ